MKEKIYTTFFFYKILTVFKQTFKMSGSFGQNVTSHPSVTQQYETYVALPENITVTTAQIQNQTINANTQLTGTPSATSQARIAGNSGLYLQAPAHQSPNTNLRTMQFSASHHTGTDDTDYSSQNLPSSYRQLRSTYQNP